MERCRAWIRIKLPDEELRSLDQEFPQVKFLSGEDGAHEPQQFDVVFTDEPLPDDLVQRMVRLKWLHVTRGGVYPYLSPTIKSRPIDVTGSKGIHGQAFSEFALACIFALAKKLPQCWEAQKERRWDKVDTEEIAGKTLGILGLGTVGSELAQKAKALGLRVVATKRNPEAKPEYVDELGSPRVPAKFAGSIRFRCHLPSLCAVNGQSPGRKGAAVDEAKRLPHQSHGGKGR